MIVNLLNDIKKSLDSENYFAALALILILPDLCGKAEFPEVKSSSKRYKDWYDLYIGKYEQSPSVNNSENPLPYLSGEVIYSLRNHFLHQGTPNIDSSKIKNTYNRIDRFELVIESKNEFDVYCDSSGNINNLMRTYRVNIRRLSLIICSSVQAYYLLNESKFSFDDFAIIDWDKEMDKFKVLHML